MRPAPVTKDAEKGTEAKIKKFCGEGPGEGELFQKFLFEYTVIQ